LRYCAAQASWMPFQGMIPIKRSQTRGSNE
jgi:hypothetical protein